MNKVIKVAVIMTLAIIFVPNIARAQNSIRVEGEPEIKVNEEFFKNGKIKNSEKSNKTEPEKTAEKPAVFEADIVIESSGKKTTTEAKIVNESVPRGVSPVEVKEELQKQVVLEATAERPKPVSTGVSDFYPNREVRFNMEQNGQKMTAEDFAKWLEAQGIRIVPAKGD